MFLKTNKHLVFFMLEDDSTNKVHRTQMIFKNILVGEY